MTSKAMKPSRKAARGRSIILHRAQSRPATTTTELAVAIAPDAFKILSPRPETVKKVVEALGRIAVGSKSSGRPRSVTIKIEPDGTSEITGLDLEEIEVAAEETADERDRAFAAARARGRTRAAEILSRDDMLSADEMAERLGISRVTVNARRQRNELLGLEGSRRGFRFPEWQVDDDGAPIQIMPRLFELLGPTPWGVYRFLTERQDALNGATALDVLRRGEGDRVLDAAEGVARGDFT